MTTQQEEPPTLGELYAERDGRLEKARFWLNLFVISIAINLMIFVDEAIPEEEKEKLAQDIEDLRYDLFRLRTAWQYLRGERWT